MVEDVAWHCKHPDIFGSVGDDKLLMLWDKRRSPAEACTQRVEAHSAEVNCLSFNPHNEFLLATGSADNTVALYDMRRLEQRLHTLEGHTEEARCRPPPGERRVFFSLVLGGRGNGVAARGEKQAGRPSGAAGGHRGAGSIAARESVRA